MGGLAITMILTAVVFIMVIHPQNEKQRDELKNMSCESLKQYIINHIGDNEQYFSNIAQAQFTWRCAK